MRKAKLSDIGFIVPSAGERRRMVQLTGCNCQRFNRLVRALRAEVAEINLHHLADDAPGMRPDERRAIKQACTALKNYRDRARLPIRDAQHTI